MFTMYSGFFKKSFAPPSLIPSFVYRSSLPGNSGGVDTLAVATDGAGNVVVNRFASGLYAALSTNGGLSWTNVNTGAFTGGYLGGMVYNNGEWMSTTYPGIMNRTSTPSSSTWTQITSGLMGGASYGGAGNGSNTVVFGGDSSQAYEYSVNNGATWANTTGWPIAYCSGLGGLIYDGTQFVAVGPDSGPTLSYVLTAPNFTSGAPTWSTAASVALATVNFTLLSGCGNTLAYQSGVGYAATCIGPSVSGHVQAGFVIASTPAGLLSATIQHPMLSASANAFASGVWIFNGLIFVGDSAGNFAGSSNGGVTWTPITMPYNYANEYVQGFTYDPTNNVYIAVGKYGSVMTALA